MPITVGCLNLQFLIQKYLIPPYHIDSKSLQMARTPSTVIYSLSTWKSHQNLEALGFYSILAAICCIAGFTYDMLDVHLNDFCFVLTQRFKLLGVPSSATDFLGVLGLMGVLATSGAAFVMLTMYRVLPFLFYLACSLIVPAGITIDFLLVLLGSVTNSNGQRFKLFWKQFGKLKRDQMQLKSCPPIGYSIGPVINVTKQSTAFRIADAIVNGAVTLSLTQLGIHKSNTVFYSLSTWKSNQNLEALGIYSILAAICCIAWFTYDMLDVHLNDFCFVLTQRFKLLGVPSSGRSTRNQKPDTYELLIYGFGAGFCAFPLIVSLIPLIRDYDPFLKIFFRLLSVSLGSGCNLRYFLKALVSGFYGATATHAAGVVLSTVLLALMVIEAPHKLSFDLYERHRQAMKITTKLKFYRCLRLFRILQIMIGIANVIATDFLGVLGFMGVLATSGAAFVMLTMYKVLPFLFYLACSLIVPVGITVDFLLVLVASVTNSNGQRFKLFWKQFGKLKRDQKQLKSCPPIGYSIGPVIQVTKQSTAFRIADAIVNGAVTLALTQFGIHKSK
ncbi:unnamed protein product [Orchesella dallaii]|uniref:Uncharacterized protein n=1 Tax=Orchesella dallaii TaxID=48710 RepID=A0ABP1S1I9_9HEXA